MIVQVLKGYQGQRPSQLVMQTVGDLTAALRAEVETGVDEAINAYAETLNSTARFEEARKLLGTIRNGAIRVEDIPASTPPKTHAANDPQARFAALSLAEIMTDANPVDTANKKKKDKVLLKPADFSYLLAELYDIAVQAKGGTAPDVTIFDPATVGTDKMKFYSKLVEALLPK